MRLDCLCAWCVATMLCAVTGCTNSSGSSQPAPIRLLDLDDQPFELWPNEQNPVTVVIFTRSDCPIANRCAPEIVRLYETYHPRGVEFFLIYVDPREQPETIRKHLKEYSYPCRSLRDPHHTLVALCNATTTPEAVVFNQDRSILYAGRVNDQYEDLGSPRAFPTTHDLADAIEATLLNKPVATPRTRAIGCPIADLKN